MPTRYILVSHTRPVSQVEVYLYTHTKIIGHLSDETLSHTLLETTAIENDVSYLANYQADRLSSDGRFGVTVYMNYEEAASAMLTQAGAHRNA